MIITILISLIILILVGTIIGLLIIGKDNPIKRKTPKEKIKISQNEYNKLKKILELNNSFINTFKKKE